MTPALLRLAAHMLGMAADEFGNHGCNDFDVSTHLDAEDQATLARAAWEANGLQPDEDPADGNLGDWQIMNALARMVNAEAGRTDVSRAAILAEQTRPPFPTCSECGCQAVLRRPVGWRVVVPIDSDGAPHHLCPVCGDAPENTRCSHCGYQVAPIDGACSACGETL